MLSLRLWRTLYGSWKWECLRRPLIHRLHTVASFVRSHYTSVISKLILEQMVLLESITRKDHGAGGKALPWHFLEYQVAHSNLCFTRRWRNAPFRFGKLGKKETVHHGIRTRRNWCAKPQVACLNTKRGLTNFSRTCGIPSYLPLQRYLHYVLSILTK